MSKKSDFVISELSKSWPGKITITRDRRTDMDSVRADVKFCAQTALAHEVFTQSSRDELVVLLRQYLIRIEKFQIVKDLFGSTTAMISWDLDGNATYTCNHCYGKFTIGGDSPSPMACPFCGSLITTRKVGN